MESLFASLEQWWNNLSLWWSLRPSFGSDSGYSPAVDVGGFLGLLAFSVAVFTLSGPKFQIRQSTAILPFRPLFFWVLIIAGAITFGLQALALLDFQFPEQFNPSLINLIVAGILAILIVYWMKICFIGPPRFTRLTARRYFDQTFSYVANGSRDELLALARELFREIPEIIKRCPKYERFPLPGKTRQKPSETEKYAHNLLLLLSDTRFCDVVVDELPAFPAHVVQQMIRLRRYDVPAHLIVRRMVIAFLSKPKSALFVENEWLGQGYIGESKPITNAIFYNWHKVEQFEGGVESPLDLDYPYAASWDTETWRVYFGMARAYAQGLAKSKSGSASARGVYHVIETTKRAYEQIGRLEKYESLHDPHNPYWHANEANRFINDLVKIFSEADDYVYFDRGSDYDYGDDLASKLAKLTCEALYHASEVNTVEFRMWDVQHNLVWTMLERHPGKDTEIQRMARRKLRRMIWDEVKRMDDFPNYKGARYIRFCLNVLGFYEQSVHRKDPLGRDAWPLTKCISAWIARRYSELVESHPPIAEFMLPANITYDKKKNRLIRTKLDEMTGREKTKSFALKPPASGTAAE